MSRLVSLLLVVWLAGCVTPVAPEPREVRLAAAPDVTLRAVAGLLMERGYVIRHADAEGHLEAALARWPGYGVSLRVTPDAGAARIAVTATRAGKPLPPRLLDPLLVDLQARLGLLP